MITLNTRQFSFALTTLTVLGFLTPLPVKALNFRSIDGSGNNLLNTDWGREGTQSILPIWQLAFPIPYTPESLFKEMTLLQVQGLV
jgi:hypothetical protein